MAKRERTFNFIIRNILVLFLMTVFITGCGDISDGEYAASVVMSGGSGRAYIESPCKVTVEAGKITAKIVWSSPNYDYMVVDGATYYPVNSEGNSTFLIPVVLDKEMVVSADTVAMSKPHLIEYTLTFSIIKEEKEGNDQTFQINNDEVSSEFEETKTAGNDGFEEILIAPEIPGLSYIGTDQNSYAKCYAIHRYSEDYVLISVYDGRKYLIIPEGGKAPDNIDEDIKLMQKPFDSIYLAASGSMCHFDSIGAIPNVVLSGLEKEKWYIEAVQKAMEAGTLEYGGKYSAPDYEKIIDKDINLVIENTMILHTPKVLEKLESLGIPVFIDRSNYEEDPLGRCEWIKIYGLLTDKENEAGMAFGEQKSLIDNLEKFENSDNKVIVFSINANHMVYVKKKSDYFSKMIEMAGGSYISNDKLEQEGSSTQSAVTMEAFYDYASEADILIYNATIENAPNSLAELVETEALFADFKAVKEGNVWYTDKSMYQFADETGTIIEELNRIFTGKEEETSFFHKLR
nr:ABC transporter substrate-binding protein [uncultured Butyrivibrio sp.]